MKRPRNCWQIGISSLGDLRGSKFLLQHQIMVEANPQIMQDRVKVINTRYLEQMQQELGIQTTGD